MASVSSFLLLVVLFFSVPIERGSGLPTKIKANDHEESLSENEKVHIREVIRLALEEFKDEDIMDVLKESLELRFEICFSPFPSTPISPDEMSDSNGLMEDEEFTPEQKKGLRELLLECLEHFDEQEMLDFLKHSIEFRVKYCPWPGHFLYPGPSPGPRIAPRTITEQRIPNSSAKPTGASASPSPAANTVGPLPEASISMDVVAEGDQPTEPTAEYVAADTPRLSEEDALSGMSRRDEMSPSVRDEPNSQAQITGNDALAKLDKVIKKLASHPELQSRHRIVGKDTAAKLDKLVSKKLTKLPKLPNYEMAVNSDEGEFSSVMRIDYNAMEDDSEPAVVEVELGLAESNEELS